jgi:hypothetical protein
MTSIDTREDIKEYILEEGDGYNYIERRFYDLYDFLDHEDGRVYISGIPGEVHVAIDDSKYKFIKEIGMKSISINNLFEVQQRIFDIIDLSDRIIQFIK